MLVLASQCQTMTQRSSTSCWSVVNSQLMKWHQQMLMIEGQEVFLWQQEFPVMTSVFHLTVLCRVGFTMSDNNTTELNRLLEMCCEFTVIEVASTDAND